MAIYEKFLVVWCLDAVSKKRMMSMTGDTVFGIPLRARRPKNGDMLLRARLCGRFKQCRRAPNSGLKEGVTVIKVIQFVNPSMNLHLSLIELSL